jgi:predicted aminopeptidase
LVSLKIAFLCILLLSSCAKVGYVFEQGVGQFSLLMSGVDNEKMLKDPKVKPEHKEKIRKIEKYKKYFYEYFERKTTDIYSETTILKGDAVTYLVISSPFDKIEALEECFIFAGCFPYLGFFKESSAKEFAKDQEEDGLVTYIRPVYAYSTLGNFEDNILSSFFYYDDIGLAELVFHELFHTIFFAKDEVDLNENLANYFGQEMVLDYFKLDEMQKKERKASREKSSNLSMEVVVQAKKLQELYKLKTPKTKKDSEVLLAQFLKESFIPSLEKKCTELGIDFKKCFPLKRSWNNASLAAFLTYEKSMDKIHSIRDSKGLSLKDFFSYIEKEYNSYRDKGSKDSFEAWFLNK